MDIRQHATSNYMHRFTCHYVISGLGLPRPRRPLAFVQPCQMGVMPLTNMQWSNVERSRSTHRMVCESRV